MNLLIYIQNFNILDLAREDWEKMKADNEWNEVHLRDNRYNQVIHMVSSARGAEVFYTVTGHQTRHESISQAVDLDKITAGVSNNMKNKKILQCQNSSKIKAKKIVERG